MDAHQAAARIRESLDEQQRSSTTGPVFLDEQLVRALLDRMDELAKDAARYGLLRSNHWRQGEETLVVVRARSLRLGAQTYSGHLLDEAVDPALTNKD